jgi:anaerobic magnesium-protoporphyrin IX monomethyl ester cyclase
MNVLIVFPFSIIAWNNKYEEPRIPLNITYLASAARKAGHHVNLVDLRVEQQKRGLDMPDSLECDDVKLLTKCMEDKIVENSIEVVGINCLYSGLFPAVVHLAKQIKTLNSNIKVVLGGIHPTIYTKEILNQYKEIIDYVIIGEGESSFVKLLDCLSTNEYSGIDNIDGLGYFKNEQARMNRKNNYIDNLDELPFPAVDLLNISDYFTDTSGWHSPKGFPIKTPVPIITSRSCPNMCNFCSMHFVHGKKIRYRSPENVIEEMKTYINRYGLNYFNITDDNLTIDRKRVIRLMDLIVKENLNIQFSTENGVYLNTLDEDVLDAMSRAGLVRLHLAFETGSDYIRTKVIGKHLYNKKIDELRNILSKDKYNHIYLYGYFVIGFPEETEETLEETYQLMTSFPLDNYSVFYATPYPGTKLYDQCLRERLFTEEYFYDADSLVNQVNVGQMVKGLPFVKPYNLEPSKLVDFKNKMLDYLKKKRSDSSVPMSSPLRFSSIITQNDKDRDIA